MSDVSKPTEHPKDDRIPSTADRVMQPDAPKGNGSYNEEQPTVITDKKRRGDPIDVDSTESALGKGLVGQTLGHFQLDAFIGSGGMGAVFRGHDTLLDRRVAVKVLSGENNSKEDTVRRFRNEAQSAARLDHPNIARVYFVGEDKGWNYIVFEFIDGENLRDQVEKEGPLEVEEAISYLVQIAEALDHATKRNIVHRDIKPSNILVDRNQKAKLVDMGLARLHQVNSPGDDLTASGMTLGTFDYISPEQARDPRSADVRSDLYSLGCTFFYMLTGRPPFPDGTVLQKLLSHSSEDPPDPREFRPEIPDEVVRILSQMMAKNPSKRFQTPAELIAMILIVVEELQLEIPHFVASNFVPAVEPKSSVIEQHLPWVVPVMVLLVVVLVADIVWSAKDDSWIGEPAYVPLDQLQSVGVTSASRRSTTLPRTEQVDLPVIPLPLDSEGQDSQDNEDRIIQTERAKPKIDFMPEESDAPNAEINSDAPSKPVIGPATANNVISIPDQVSGLSDAIALATNNPAIDTIELNFNGELIEQVLTLQGLDLTIRAGQGFRPNIAFNPASSDPGGALISIISGSLTIEGVHLQLKLPSSSNQYSLFAMNRAERLILRGSEISISRQADSMLPVAVQRNAAVIAVTSSSESGKEFLMQRTSNISLENSFVRGSSSLVRSSGRDPLRIVCQNSLVAVSGSLIHSKSLSEFVLAGGFVDMNLQGCTIDCGSSVIHREGASFLPLQLSFKDCVLQWPTGSPLLFQKSATQSIEEIVKSIRFAGDQNCYCYADSVPTMTRYESSVPQPSEQIQDFYSWSRSRDELFSNLSDSVWQDASNSGKPFWERKPANYHLWDDLSNPALRQNERNAGVDFQLLPFAKAASSEL